MKILVLEPSEKNRGELLSLLEAVRIQDTAGTVFVYHQPKEVFTLPMPTDTDLAFLTVNGMADLEAARQFKRLHRGVALVVISDSAEYAVESYTLPAASYLIRPLEKNAVATVLAAILQKMQENADAEK